MATKAELASNLALLDSAITTLKGTRDAAVVARDTALANLATAQQQLTAQQAVHEQDFAELAAAINAISA